MSPTPGELVSDLTSYIRDPHPSFRSPDTSGGVPTEQLRNGGTFGAAVGTHFHQSISKATLPSQEFYRQAMTKSAGDGSQPAKQSKKARSTKEAATQ
ncbi:hypothetical protein M0R45_008488 [Rubus argutus]|uniref:Uncharacterized protein n=1 Tax=Rubus argutus TaxID=59490 RepID=A0AAW1Y468_RUBAR